MNIIRTSVIAAAAITIVGCGSDSDHPSNPTTQLRVTHAIPDAPKVDVKANGAIVSGLAGVDYRQGSGLITLDAGTYDFSVDAITAGDGRLEVLSLPGVSLAPDMQYDVIAIETVDTSGASPTINYQLLSRSGTAPGSNEIRVDVYHASNAVTDNVDIYLTTASDITSEDPDISGLGQFVDAPGLPATLPAGDVRIRVTPAGTKTVAFDSGVTPLSLPGGQTCSSRQSITQVAVPYPY
ncbi:hypothetical protein JCM19239_529 [Vibrio variabilis]|uniref:DUF4397 domain-containing protein n=1 Tax=Vibrio variabilis TaxID=990271 RepID=A0ABQ0J9Y9_9VIBR|nr:hypothetical protein JCM19239_529 [Vibrio variabilis]